MCIEHQQKWKGYGHQCLFRLEWCHNLGNSCLGPNGSEESRPISKENEGICEDCVGRKHDPNPGRREEERKELEELRKTKPKDPATRLWWQFPALPGQGSEGIVFKRPNPLNFSEPVGKAIGEPVMSTTVRPGMGTLRPHTTVGPGMVRPGMVRPGMETTVGRVMGTTGPPVMGTTRGPRVITSIGPGMGYIAPLPPFVAHKSWGQRTAKSSQGSSNRPTVTPSMSPAEGLEVETTAGPS